MMNIILSLEENHTACLLCESRAFEQARERSLLKWPLESYPSRKKMKEAGWFATRIDANEIATVCLYCKIAVTGWKQEDNPWKVHQILSPNCVFLRSTHNSSVSSSPILSTLPRHESIPPSTHSMACIYRRVHSFDLWPSIYPDPSADTLAAFGYFYTGYNTRVECFSCHDQILINNVDNGLMFAHADGCQYAEHLKGK